MDFLSNEPHFSSLSLKDLLEARDVFHPHLMHKANVVGTAVGRYLIRKSDPYPRRAERGVSQPKGAKTARTLENSEVRDYSWPCVLVFVAKWEDARNFGDGRRLAASDMVPPTIYLEDGRSVPVCVVEAPRDETVPPPPPANAERPFPDLPLSPGYPLEMEVQGATHRASIGCLVTDGHTIYALTNRHVAGRTGERVYTIAGGKRIPIGTTADKQLGRLPFEKVYGTWPGRHIYVNCDVGLVELDDQTVWNPAIFGIGQMGPLADLSIYNFTLQLIGCPVRAYGSVSGALYGRIAALFYRYKSVGGFEYVADFLIGSRNELPLNTHPGDSGTVWVIEGDAPERDRMPLAIQWGGTVFNANEARLPFALATSLSTVCRELELDLFRSRTLATFEYWEAVGHYTIGAFACQQVKNATLRSFLLKNQDRISFEVKNIDKSVNKVHGPGFVPLADVPDRVWKHRPKKSPGGTPLPGRASDDSPTHYADIDYPPGAAVTLDSLTQKASDLKTATWAKFYKDIGWNAPSKRGSLPFRVWQIYKKMVEFVQNKDMVSYVCAAGILAHYVGDACQPLHGSYLTHGDPFRNPDGSKANQEIEGLGNGYGGGVHEAYEGTMLDTNYKELLADVGTALSANHGMNLLKGGQNAGYATVELMRRARKTLPPMDIVEAYGKLVVTGKASTAPVVLWGKFQAPTVRVIADGCNTLAMLWESAWVEGGGNTIPGNLLVAIDTEELRRTYESQDFLPSKALGQLGPFL